MMRSASLLTQHISFKKRINLVHLEGLMGTVTSGLTVTVHTSTGVALKWVLGIGLGMALT